MIKGIDSDPKTNMITEALWDDLNQGMKFYNNLADEVRKKRTLLAQLQEELVKNELNADNSVLER